jgi:hypothetical protein
MKLDPVVFADGTDFFEGLKKKYITHKKGLFIMTPSGAGKTHFCKQQKEPHWIDGDDLWLASKAQPQTDWWNGDMLLINRVEQRCDIITAQACKMGFWIMGSINFYYQPDAIVIPKWETLVNQIKKRQETGYDGGLTEAHHEQLKLHIYFIEQWHLHHNVPKFESVEEAVAALTT